MASLQQDIVAIIEICRSAISVPKKARPRIEARTIEDARRILVKLKDYDLGDDAALPTIRPNDRRLSWWEILSAMEAAEKLLERRLDRRPS
jgi:hypothetical protein